MITKTRIDWCNYTWSPVIGCSRKPPCPYCYAHRMNKRFHLIPDFSKPQWLESNFQKKFPKKPSRIFVNSMSDIAFWKPEWMNKVLNKIKEYPQHTFMFLTKNQEVYLNYKFPKNCWIGITLTKEYDYYMGIRKDVRGLQIKYETDMKDNLFFLNIEPILEHIYQLEFVIEGNREKGLYYEWLIIGAETGNRKDKVLPHSDWIRELIDIDIPLFMKDNLRSVWKGKFRQEWPNERL